MIISTSYPVIARTEPRSMSAGLVSGQLSVEFLIITYKDL